MPALEMAQESGRIVRWLKAEGDSVVKGEPLMEIETDKVTVDVEAPANGVLAGIRAQEGQDVPVGETVAYLLAEGERVPLPAPAPEAAPLVEAAPAVPVAPTAGPGRTLASPKARRIARDRSVDLGTIAGSGPRGAVLATDLEVRTAAGDDEAPELGAVWRRMAERTTQTWQTTPHFFLLREVDASRLVSWRESEVSRSGHEATTYTDLLVKIVAEALGRHPRANASWQDGKLLHSDEIGVGIAVAIDDGLVVPVVRTADRLGLDEITARRTKLVEAARDGRLRPEDVHGGTFTISNLGMYGVDAFLAIVNAGQSGILAVGRIADRVVPIEGQPAVRPVLTLGLSFDHRVLDGARGAAFLDTLASLVEEPSGLMT
jgi:pyruvate dehydrogenase E2 component (dihydrolipoyllysine-residue acetyltransferase)